MSNYDSDTISFGKVFATVLAIIVLALGATFICKTMHSNDVDKIQLIQDINGDITIRRDGGLYWKFFPRIWEYQKGYSYYFSNKASQSKDHDAPSVRYANTGKGDLNCQVVYRIDWADDEAIKKMHEIAHGDDTILEQRVLSTLNNIAQSAASELNSTDAIKKYKDFCNTIRNQMLHNKELRETMAIDVVDFLIAGEPDFDKKTLDLFAAQQEADLMKQTADAEKVRLISERERAIAQYEKEMAENEGKAKAQMAKEVTDAERQKRLAEIEAEKKVAVQELEKKEMLIKAQKEKEVAEVEVQKQKEVAKIEAEKLFEVAEIAKKTEAENLEKVKLVAQQTIVQAEAKKQAIALAGEITESERVKLEIEKETKIGVATAYAKGIGSMKLPTVMTGGKDGGGAETALGTFFNIKNAAMALEMAEKTEK